MNPLTMQQQEVYELVKKGKTTQEIATILMVNVSVILAQYTRMRKKGYEIVPNGGRTINISDLSESNTQPIQHDKKTNVDMIGATLSGTALNSTELEKLAQKITNKNENEVHPMILLGVTIQYVKLCGGRMSAHQVIEDVFGALKSFSEDTTTQEKPIDELTKLKREYEDLKRKFDEFNNSKNNDQTDPMI